MIKDILIIGGASSALMLILKSAYDRMAGSSKSVLIDTINFFKNQLETKEKEWEDQSKRLLEENISLKIRLVEEKLLVENLPFMYVKLDDQARVIDFSNIYTDKWLKPMNKNPFEYRGKTSAEFWGEAIAEDWTAHDLKCIKTGESFVGKESLIFSGRDQLEEYVIYKTCTYDKSGKKILHMFLFEDKKILKLFQHCNINETKQ